MVGLLYEGVDLKNGGNNKMMNHILLEKAFIYPLPKSDPDMSGMTYDNKRGFWVQGNGKPAVSDPAFSGPRSKKCDIETGEDQKGE